MCTSRSNLELRRELIASQRKGADELRRVCAAAMVDGRLRARRLPGAADCSEPRRRRSPPSASTGRPSAIVPTRAIRYNSPMLRGWRRRQASRWSPIFAAAMSPPEARARRWCRHSTPRCLVARACTAWSSISAALPTSRTCRADGSVRGFDTGPGNVLLDVWHAAPPGTALSTTRARGRPEAPHCGTACATARRAVLRAATTQEHRTRPFNWRWLRCGPGGCPGRPRDRAANARSR